MLKMASESFIFVLDSSSHGNLNSPLLSNSSPLQQRAFYRKRISLVYVFHALFNRRSSNLFKLFSAKRGQHSESFQSSPKINRMQDSFAYNESFNSLTVSLILDSSFFQPLKYPLVPK